MSNCDWCDEPVLDMMPQIKVSNHVYHLKCMLEYGRWQDEQYERQKYLEQKWEER